MSRSTIITIVILILIIGAAALYTFSRSTPPEFTDADSALLPGEGVAPYTDLEGNIVSFDDFRGDIIVANAWASWCPFCVNELPDFATVAAEYSDRGVTVLAINRKEDRRIAIRFLETLNNPKDIMFILDPDDNFYNSIGGFTMPETVFYDREGNIFLHKRGFMDKAEMRGHIDRALAASNNGT
ncbi:MAG: TlpA disulfide reductase family protein [Patescibacteria group bacterium]